MSRYILILTFLATVFASCEDNMFLKSEKKMKQDLQGKWQREFLGDSSIHHIEYWIFDGDNLYTTYTLLDVSDQNDDGAPDFTVADNVDTIVISGFKIDTKTFRAYLKFQLITRGLNDSTPFYDKWEFVTLEDNVLYLATDNVDGTTVEQREFFKIE